VVHLYAEMGGTIADAAAQLPEDTAPPE